MKARHYRGWLLAVAFLAGHMFWAFKAHQYHQQFLRALRSAELWQAFSDDWKSIAHRYEEQLAVAKELNGYAATNGFTAWAENIKTK